MLEFFPSTIAVPFIYVGAVFGMFWAGVCVYWITKIDITKTDDIRGNPVKEGSLNAEEK